MARWMLCIALCLSWAFSALGQERSEKLEPVVVQLRWKHQFQFAGYYAAIEQGFYADAGLSVTLREGQPGLRPIQEVGEGRAHYGVANSELLLHRLRGAPVVALAVIFQHSPSVLIVSSESSIQSPEDLVGKKVMMREGIDSAELLTMFINEGIALSEIEKVDMSYNIQDLVSGKVDAYHAYITDQPYLLGKQKVPFKLIRPITYGIDFYGDTLFTSEEELEQHPERVRAFREATLAGWVHAMEHPDEIISVILRDYGALKTREHLKFEAQAMQGHLEFEANAMRRLLHPELIELGHMNPGRWRHIAETYAQLDMGPKEFDLSGFLYDPTPEPDYTFFYQALFLFALLASAAGFVAFVLLVFNTRLQRAVAERTLELQEATSELEKHRDHLEELVVARTKDLVAVQKEVKTLSGLLPICANCKKIRDEEGAWRPLEEYISGRSEANFSHGICPSCKEDLYPELENPLNDHV